MQFKGMLTLVFWREEICAYLRYSHNALRLEYLYHLVRIALWVIYRLSLYQINQIMDCSFPNNLYVTHPFLRSVCELFLILLQYLDVLETQEVELDMIADGRPARTYIFTGEFDL